MMKRWWWLLLGGTAFGQTVSNISFDHVGDSSARILFDVSAPFTQMRVRYGLADCASGTGGTVQANGTSPATYRRFSMSATVAGLKPGTTYYVCPEVNGGPGWSSGVSATLTTLPQTQDLPIPPKLVSRVFPNQTGATRTVASDCSNLQAQMNAAVYGDTIVVPAGTICTGTYRLPDAPEAKSFAAAAVRTSDSRITLAGHGFSEGQQVRLGTNGCLPGMRIFPYGLSCEKGGGWRKGGEYIVHVLDADHIQLRGPGGAPVVPGFIRFSANDDADTLTFRPTVETPNGFQDTNGASLSPNAQVQFHTTGTLPGGLTPDTTYYLLNGCSPSGNAACTTQVSTTSGGAPIDITSAGSGTHTIVDQGTGTHRIIGWPLTDAWIVVKTSGVLPPEGVRIGPEWAAQTFHIRQTNAGVSPYRVQTGVLSHNWRFVGATFDTATNTDILTTLDPRPYGQHILTGIDSANILFERSRVQGAGYPNRFGTISMTLDGANVGWIDSDLRGMNYWHTWYSGLTAARSGDHTMTLAAGVGYGGAFTTNLTGPTTINLTGGAANGTGFVYLGMDGAMNVMLPVGMGATCTTSGTTCSVSVSGTPGWPVNGQGRVAGLRIATMTIAGGLLTAAANADGFTSANATEGSQSIIAGNGPGPYIFDNNRIEGTGIPLHFDDSGGPFLTRGDYQITRNTFSVAAEEMALGPASPKGLRYGHRQPLEWKAGNRIKVHGNIFTGNFEEDSPVSVNIALTPRSGGYVTDVDVTSNSFVNASGGVNVCSPIDSFAPVSAPCARQRFQNNVFLLNGHTRRVPGVSNGNSWAFYGGYATENILIDHNTIFDNRGVNAALLHWIGMPVSGMKITNNIYFVPGDTAAIQNENVAGCSGSNKAMMDCAFTSGPGNTSYAFSRNLLVPSWANTQTATGHIGVSAVQNAFPSPLQNYIPNGNSVAAALNNVKFSGVALNGAATGHDLRLAATSPYINKASDGTAVGANIEQLQQEQGQILQLRSLGVAATSATVSAFVPDAGAPCSAGYGTSANPATWTWTDADTADSRQRNIALSGLTSGTAYFYSVACRRTAMPGIETFRTP